LDILNNDIGKMLMLPRKPWITEAITKMDERRISKTTNVTVDLLKELSDSGFKIMSALINNIYTTWRLAKRFSRY
jgi:hypothetical protein